MLNRTLFGPLVSLAVFALMAVACGDDSSSASNDEQPGSSSDEIASSSSVMGDGCNAENEGEVKVEWVGNPKYGYDTYKRCKNGSWVEGDISLTCDTAGVQVGDTCVKQGSSNIFQAGMNPQAGEISFVYKGDGVWERTNQAQIDSLIASGKTGWYAKDNNQYSYSTSWGNGTPAPQGEKDEEDRFFKLNITKGEKTGLIVYGWW